MELSRDSLRLLPTATLEGPVSQPLALSSLLAYQVLLIEQESRTNAN